MKVQLPRDDSSPSAATTAHAPAEGAASAGRNAAMKIAVGRQEDNRHAVDSSAEMIDCARRLPAPQAAESPIEWICADALEVEIDDASMVVLNFTLQFVPIALRPALLRRIRRGMRPGAILVLSEKIRFADPETETLQNEMHHAFKRANGYNDLEISRKRTALEKVLLPETLEQHRARLAEAGFARTDLWFQCFNFVSLVARN